MERYQKITSLHRILQHARRPVTVARLQDELNCSRATVYRLLAFLRDSLMAPIEGDGDLGYYYAETPHASFELPGLWLNSDELHALLASQQMLLKTSGGALAELLQPFQERIESLLELQSGGKRWPIERIRVLEHHGRQLNQTVFRVVVGAVLARKQLMFEYRARSTNRHDRRHVSPQRITHYRNNWYLDAWDHERQSMRSFAIDRIEQAKAQVSVATDISSEALENELASSYGIFSGIPKDIATIRFSAKAARWVADQRWHSQQQGQFLEDGRYELKVPYHIPDELLMDILQYGAEAEVVAPVELRQQAQDLLIQALKHYD